LETTNGFGLGVVCALGSALTWAVVSLLARNLSDQFNSITINAIRSTLGGGIVLSLVLLQGGGAALLTLSPPVVVFLALSVLVAVGVGDTLFFEGTRTLGVAVAMTVSMSYPLITALLAVLLMGETLTLRLALGILLTLGGLALIVTGGKSPEADRSDRSRFGLVAASVAAVAWAASALLMKPPLNEVDAVTATAVRLPLIAVALWITPWTWDTVGRLRASSRATRLAIAGLGGLTAVTTVMFAAGLKYAGVAVGTVLSSTAPLFSIPLGLWFSGERFHPATAAGAIITVTGITLMQA
jgi:drug/metabolite transporter (DMT)-like permease